MPHDAVCSAWVPSLELPVSVLCLFSILCICAMQIVDKDAPKGSDKAKVMYIRVHTPMYRQPNGRPLAVVSVVDHALAQKLVDAGKLDRMSEVQRFQHVMLNHHQVGCPYSSLVVSQSALARQPWSFYLFVVLTVSLLLLLVQ